MKKLIIILSFVGALFSCSTQPTKLSSEEKNQKYLEIGQKYMTIKIESFSKEDRGTLVSVELIKVDSISDLTARKIYQIDINKKFKDWEIQNEYAKKLVDLDEAYGEITKTTKYEVDKAQKLGDEVQSMIDKQNKMSKKKIGEIVFFEAKFTNNDGSTSKPTFAIAFNEDMTVSAEAMHKFFNM